MNIKKELIFLLPNKLSFDEFGSLIMICDALKSKKNSLRVKDSELSNFLGFGDNKKDVILTSLKNKKFISISQQRDPDGRFDYALIKVITDLVEF